MSVNPAKDGAKTLEEGIPDRYFVTLLRHKIFDKRRRRNRKGIIGIKRFIIYKLEGQAASRTSTETEHPPPAEKTNKQLAWADSVLEEKEGRSAGLPSMVDRQTRRQMDYDDGEW
ncbi:hypothetical protein R1flu_003347 [Riccia fluitans]|uniref:Uncharacterized protein n=1 Tax=Riccia fluitans TaxID=41844 RepID=A0ABD1Y8R6_9MARC